MRAFEFIVENEEWKKNKLKIEIPGQSGEFYISEEDGELMLHGIDVTSFAWSDRDGDSHEGLFDFDYNIAGEEIVNIEWPELDDEGFYVDGAESFSDDVADVITAFEEAYDEEAIQRFRVKLSPEEGGLEVDDNWFEANIPFAGKKVGHKEGPAGQWKNKGPSAKRPARPGDLVGGSAA